MEFWTTYFEDNYVVRFHVNAPRGIPTFPIDFWNIFHCTDDKPPRTNNAVFTCQPVF